MLMYSEETDATLPTTLSVYRCQHRVGSRETTRKVDEGKRKESKEDR